MIRVKHMIYCKNEEDLKRIQDKYPYPTYQWYLYERRSNFPLFLVHDKVDMEVYRVSPLKAIQVTNQILKSTREPKVIELCNKIITVAREAKEDKNAYPTIHAVTQQPCIPESYRKSLRGGIITPQFLSEHAEAIGLVKDGEIVPEKERDIIKRNEEKSDR